MKIIRHLPRSITPMFSIRLLYLPVLALMVVFNAPVYNIDRALAVELIAHRGASHDAPENTLAAFRLAFQQGADGIEGDFYLSADGHVVCIHDSRTRRVADADLTVSKSTLAQLRKLDVGRWKDPSFTGERIPTLTEILSILPKDKKFFIEIKCGPEIIPALKKDIESSTVSRSQLTIIAFKAAVIAACRREMPDISALWLTSWKKRKVGSGFTPSRDDVLETLRQIDANGLDANANPDALDKEFSKKLRSADFELHCWTVDDPNLARRMIETGVRSITTNRPAWLRQQLEERSDPSGDESH